MCDGLVTCIPWDTWLQSSWDNGCIDNVELLHEVWRDHQNISGLSSMWSRRLVASILLSGYFGFLIEVYFCCVDYSSRFTVICEIIWTWEKPHFLQEHVHSLAVFHSVRLASTSLSVRARHLPETAGQCHSEPFANLVVADLLRCHTAYPLLSLISAH